MLHMHYDTFMPLYDSYRFEVVFSHVYIITITYTYVYTYAQKILSQIYLSVAMWLRLKKCTSYYT